MAVTFRQMLNRVLSNTSEDELDSSAGEITERYHKLVRNFINHIKEEIEDAHNWRALRSTEQVTLTGGTNSVVITNANERSRLVRVQNEHQGRERALVFDVTTSTSPVPLTEMDLPDLLMRQAQDAGATNADPVWFAMDNTSGDVLAIKVHPTPAGDRTIDVTLIIPQDRIAGDGTDIDDTIKIPTFALEMGATWYAYEERGEELGVGSVFSEGRFRIAVDAAIARDMAESGELQLVPA
jgi:hypothetical protein